MPTSELTLAVTLAVLGAGLLHAGWNALLKSAPGGDPLLDTATVVAGSGAWGLVAIPFVGIPDATAWTLMVLSVFIHWAYYITLAHAYRTGDLSFAYPLMRGTAPLLATLLGIMFLREWPTPQVALGILLICAGIVGIAFVGRNPHPRAALVFALANAAIIAVYTLIDGAGVRVAADEGDTDDAGANEEDAKRDLRGRPFAQEHDGEQRGEERGRAAHQRVGEREIARPIRLRKGYVIGPVDEHRQDHQGPCRGIGSADERDRHESPRTGAGDDGRGVEQRVATRSGFQ